MADPNGPINQPRRASWSKPLPMHQSGGEGKVCPPSVLSPRLGLEEDCLHRSQRRSP